MSAETRPNSIPGTPQSSASSPIGDEAVGVARGAAVDWAVAILNDAADGILTIDERGCVQWMNPAAEALFGYGAAEMIGRDVKLLMPPPDRERHDGYISNYLKTGHRKIIGIGREVVGQRKDGTRFPMYLSVCESIVGGTRIFGAIARDLTDRKVAEEELRRERDINRRLLATAQAIVLVLDAHGRIVQFNEHTERLTGRALDEVRGRDWFETFVPERERAQARWLFKQSVAGRSSRGNVYPILTRANAERQIEWYESALEHGDGRAAGLLCIGLDVTERIEAEGQRYAYEEKLRSLTVELITSEERERRELAAELHDQIGQTLALAKIKLGALREAVPAPIVAQVTEIRDLVDHAVRSSRSLTVELGATILNELGLEAALSSLAEELRDRHRVTCTFTDEGGAKPLAEQTRVALFRATRELLMNVVKHAAARRAEVAVRRNESTIFIRVRDDGAGFLVPTDGFHASKKGGFGLFSIQERLARLGGSMSVASTPGAGSTITLAAPLLRPGEGEHAA